MKMPFAENPNFPVTQTVNSRVDRNKYIAIEDVEAANKRPLWEAIKKHKPESAKVITGSFFAEIKKTFSNAKIVLSETEINELLRVNK